MRRATVWALLLVAVLACDGVYRIVVEMPYCPASDSAKAKADSIPVVCLFPDTTDSTP